MTLDAELPEQHIQDVVSNIYKDSKSTPLIQIAPGSNIGEGFIGVTAAITVNFPEDVKHLFFKMTVQDPLLRESIFLKDAFLREITFYSKVIPAYKELYSKYTKEEFDVSPNCVYTSTQELKECIVLDNLSAKQYKVVKSKECFDKEHLMMTLNTYSRLHACGFILKAENPHLFQEFFIGSQSCLFAKFAETYGFGKMGGRCLDILKKHCCLKADKDILENLENLRRNVVTSLNFLRKTENYCTIIHADCWRNNLMFKYQESGTQLEALKIIDFQMWTIHSPMIDIAHTIYSNAHSTEVLESLDYYLDFYYTSLSKYIIKMGENPDKLFPREVMFQHWRKYVSYGLLFGLAATRCIVGGPDCLPNIVEHIKANKPLNETFVFDIPNEKEYCERMKVLVRHFVKNGYF